MPGRSLGTAQSSCGVVGPPHTKEENKERADMSGQNSLDMESNSWRKG